MAPWKVHLSVPGFLSSTTALERPLSIGAHLFPHCIVFCTAVWFICPRTSSFSPNGRQASASLLSFHSPADLQLSSWKSRLELFQVKGVEPIEPTSHPTQGGTIAGGLTVKLKHEYCRLSWMPAWGYLSRLSGADLLAALCKPDSRARIGEQALGLASNPIPHRARQLLSWRG